MLAASRWVLVSTSETEKRKGATDMERKPTQDTFPRMERIAWTSEINGHMRDELSFGSQT